MDGVAFQQSSLKSTRSADSAVADFVWAWSALIVGAAAVLHGADSASAIAAAVAV